jgi:small neutral amino acid transporter SnatA (MarC family)
MAEHRDGQSTAAWTAVTILLIASFLMCLAVVVKSWALAIVGIVLVVVGVAAGKILAMAGFGQVKAERQRASTDLG